MNSENSNSSYEIRLNDYSFNFIAHHQIERPKCSISPVNQSSIYESSTNDSATSNHSHLFSNAPYLMVPNLNVSHISPFVNKTLANKVCPNQHDSGFFQQSYADLSNQYISSPNLQIHAKNLALESLKEKKILQSTPNKIGNQTVFSSLKVPVPSDRQTIKNQQKVNFHSIFDLAQSDNAKKSDSNTETSTPKRIVQAESNILGRTWSNKAASPNYSNVSNQNSFSSFNEHLKYFSQTNFSQQNKENDHRQELISKTMRRPRAQISRQQRDILEYAYKLKCYPDSNEVEYLCNILGFEENVIRIWFQNKRARNKNRTNTNAGNQNLLLLDEKFLRNIGNL